MTATPVGNEFARAMGAWQNQKHHEASQIEAPISCCVTRWGLRNCKVTLTPPDMYSMQAQARSMACAGFGVQFEGSSCRWLMLVQLSNPIYEEVFMHFHLTMHVLEELP